MEAQKTKKLTKIISITMLIAMTLALCACGSTAVTTAADSSAPAADTAPASPSNALEQIKADGVLELQSGSIEALAVAQGNAEAIIASTPDLVICAWQFDVAAEYEANVIMITKDETELLNVVNEALAKAYADGLYGPWYEDAKALSLEASATEVTVED